jgi:hypothetical protein
MGVTKRLVPARLDHCIKKIAASAMDWWVSDLTFDLGLEGSHDEAQNPARPLCKPDFSALSMIVTNLRALPRSMAMPPTWLGDTQCSSKPFAARESSWYEAMPMDTSSFKTISMVHSPSAAWSVILRTTGNKKPALPTLTTDKSIRQRNVMIPTATQRKTQAPSIAGDLLDRILAARYPQPRPIFRPIAVNGLVNAP